MYTQFAMCYSLHLIHDMICIHIWYNIYIYTYSTLYTILCMIFLCSLRPNPETGGLIYKFAATALNAAGESLQRKPYRMDDHHWSYSWSMAIVRGNESRILNLVIFQRISVTVNHPEHTKIARSFVPCRPRKQQRATRESPMNFLMTNLEVCWNLGTWRNITNTVILANFSESFVENR